MLYKISGILTFITFVMAIAFACMISTGYPDEPAAAWVFLGVVAFGSIVFWIFSKLWIPLICRTWEKIPAKLLPADQVRMMQDFFLSMAPVLVLLVHGSFIVFMGMGIVSFIQHGTLKAFFS